MVPNFGAKGDGWEGAMSRDLDCMWYFSPEGGDKKGRGVGEVWDAGDGREEVPI